MSGPRRVVHCPPGESLIAAFQTEYLLQDIRRGYSKYGSRLGDLGYTHAFHWLQYRTTPATFARFVSMTKEEMRKFMMALCEWADDHCAYSPYLTLKPIVPRIQGCGSRIVSEDEADSTSQFAGTATQHDELSPLKKWDANGIMGMDYSKVESRVLAKVLDYAKAYGASDQKAKEIQMHYSEIGPVGPGPTINTQEPLQHISLVYGVDVSAAGGDQLLGLYSQLETQLKHYSEFEETKFTKAKVSQIKQAQLVVKRELNKR